jgi:hypothetical protein
MERIMAVLTNKQESFVGAVGITGVPTHRARLARRAEGKSHSVALRALFNVWLRII